jgi:hypothetical protein
VTYSQTDIITSKQLLAFLAAKHKGTVCAKCGVNALEPLVETEGSPNVAHVHLPIKGMGYLAAAAMVCRNCGDISQYWWDAIQDWIELNKIGPDG